MSFTSVSCSAWVIWPTFSSRVMVPRTALACASKEDRRPLARAAAGAAAAPLVAARTPARQTADRAPTASGQVFMSPPGQKATTDGGFAGLTSPPPPSYNPATSMILAARIRSAVSANGFVSLFLLVLVLVLITPLGGSGI